MKLISLIFIIVLYFSQVSFGGTVETFELKNNIKVIFKKTEGVEIISLKIFSPVSIINENTDYAGITYLLHRVMNKSTKKRNSKELAEDVESLGTSISPEVDYDFSGFSLSCMSQYFKESCEILSDIILNPVFDENELNKERDLISETIKSRQDSISQTANDKFISDFYGNYPYSYTKYGKTDTLKKIMPKDIQARYEQVYFSKNIIITVVGNISKSALKTTLEKYFGKLKLKIDKQNAALFNSDNKEREVTVDSKFNQSFIIYAYPAPNLFDNDFATLKLINAVLGGRMTGRLFVELREKLGLAYEVNAGFPARTGGSYFEIYIGLDKKNIEVAKKGIEKILQDLCDTKISQEELRDTKNFIKGIYLLDHQTTEKQAYYLAWREIVGLGYEYDEQYIHALEKVTADDIQKAAAKYFKQNPYKLILKSKN